MTKTKENRICFIDELRGILILYVVIYHFVYDISMFSPSVQLWLFSDVVQFIRVCLTGALIFISGISCLFSRSNLKRGRKTFLIGMGITLFTYFFLPEEIILFGIMHFFGLSMIIYALCEKILRFIPPFFGMFLCLFLFLFSYGIYYNELGLFGHVFFRLPDNFTLPTPLFFLGISPNTIYSADYYPLFPWIFLFLSGSFAGKGWMAKTLPDFFYKKHNHILTVIGQHTMIIYLLHQPILYGIVQLFNLIKEGTIRL